LGYAVLHIGQALLELGFWVLGYVFTEQKFDEIIETHLLIILQNHLNLNLKDKKLQNLNIIKKRSILTEKYALNISSLLLILFLILFFSIICFVKIN